ncbi:RagB/SusD family nutrient uptake outer membrane protein [Flagellimonas eckloniae]|uniref:Carbohydrate-binding protein SusD n=1 Tax=Flagellimonas eckloniae TaxID=346185 RepID=A0A0Q1BGX4_9FLAO|nr:RagB/SusD family nutrient uptake outer membrane protein [Allomuricauda eckloniae]KQC29681.1 hypothetical protein AAY42_07120 [Allomuricauda eckloniae]
MKKVLFFFCLCFALLQVSCSNGDSVPPEEEQEVEVGTLEVVTIFEGGELVSDIFISTIPETEEIITNDLGKAIFDNIEIGTYQIIVEPSFLDEGIMVSAEVNDGQTTMVEVVVGPTPISMDPLDIDVLLSATYESLKGNFLFDATGYSHYWGDIGMETIFLNQNSLGIYGELDSYDFSPANSVITDVWAEHYKIIRLTNLGLDSIYENDFVTDNNTDPLTAEAEFRFLRALLYFNLVKLYGNPMLVTTAKIDFDAPLIYEQGRAPVYEQIVEDLKFAQENLVSSSPNNRASNEIATALLGKVYITMAGFPLMDSDKYVLALQELEKVVASFTLEEDYTQVFDLENEITNSEVIFSIDFDNSGNYGVPWGPKGISLNDRFLLSSGFVGEFFNNSEIPSEPVAFPISTADSRFYQNIATFSYQNGVITDENLLANWRPFKFVKNPTVPSVINEESFDYPYLRLADIYLLIAEAENAINGPTNKAYDALNLVRRRAFGDLNHDLQPGLSQNEFFNAIIKERKLELCFEGQLKDDLIRMQALEVEISNFNELHPDRVKDFQLHEYIWPIPQTEILLSPNTVQNPGY